MKRKTKLDQNFADSTHVKLDMNLNQRKIIINLRDSKNRKCLFNFEEIKDFFLDFSEDEADTIDNISNIEQLDGNKSYNKYVITFVFETRLEISCNKFYYETEY